MMISKRFGFIALDTVIDYAPADSSGWLMR